VKTQYLDSHLSVRSRRHYEKGTSLQREPLHNFKMLSVSAFEKTPIYQLITEQKCKNELTSICNQLKLFD
jgi:hypothetical protein